MNKTQQKLNDYEGFVEKFKPKKTTDDCYTPPLVYDAVLRWVKERYQIADTTRVIRPFYPGGDYQSEDYTGDCIVVDNPPFSILTPIVRWYQERGIRFFLFAPHLTLFSSSVPDITRVVTNTSIIYANGANVNTSFITNLSPSIAIEVAGELHKEVEKAVSASASASLPKYAYPPEVLLSTSKVLSDIAKSGGTWRLPSREVHRLGALDAQRAKDKTMYGSGYLISERLAQERLAQERLLAERNPVQEWELSPREREIIQGLCS